MGYNIYPPEPTLAQQKKYDDIPSCFCLEFLKYGKKEIDAFLFLHAQKLVGIQRHKANLESNYCFLLVFQTRKYEHQVLKLMVKHSSFSDIGSQHGSHLPVKIKQESIMDYWPGERCISLSNQSIANSIVSELKKDFDIESRFGK